MAEVNKFHYLHIVIVCFEQFGAYCVGEQCAEPFLNKSVIGEDGKVSAFELLI